MTAVLQDTLPRVFVSHSQEDSAFCHQLTQDLSHALGNEDTVWYEIDEEVDWLAVVDELTCTGYLVYLFQKSGRKQSNNNCIVTCLVSRKQRTGMVRALFDALFWNG